MMHLFFIFLTSYFFLAVICTSAPSDLFDGEFTSASSDITDSSLNENFLAENSDAIDFDENDVFTTTSNIDGSESQSKACSSDMRGKQMCRPSSGTSEPGKATFPKNENPNPFRRDRSKLDESTCNKGWIQGYLVCDSGRKVDRTHVFGGVHDLRNCKRGNVISDAHDMGPYLSGIY